MSLYQLGDVAPRIAASAWVADGAQVIGAVELAEEASVWFGVVLRGDNEPIRIGRGSNVQDGSIFHTDPGYPLTVGEFVTVGHQVMLHGCSIGDETLIGMQAVVMNGARIGRHCLVAAGAVVTAGKDFADGSLIVGSPAKIARPLREDEIDGLRQMAKRYVANAARYRHGLKLIA